MMTIRGISSEKKGSGVWWIRWTDSDGKKRREKAGRRSDAITLLAKRKTEKLRQAKLPETIDNAILFSELLDDALEHSQATNGERSTRELALKVNRLRPRLGRPQSGRNRKTGDCPLASGGDGQQRLDGGHCQPLAGMFFAHLPGRLSITRKSPRIRPRASAARRRTIRASVSSPLRRKRRICKALSTRCPSYLPAFIVSPPHRPGEPPSNGTCAGPDIDLERRSLTVKKAEDGKGGAAHSAEPDRPLGLQEPSRRGCGPGAVSLF